MTAPQTQRVVFVSNRQRRLKVDQPRFIEAALESATLARVCHREISVALVRDPSMARLNAAFHDTQGPTDILTFDYGTSAEIIISVDHVIAQAGRLRTTAGRELALYLVHGLLHLAGSDDRAPAARRAMRRAERRLLAALARRLSLAALARVDSSPRRA